MKFQIRFLKWRKYFAEHAAVATADDENSFRVGHTVHRHLYISEQIIILEEISRVGKQKHVPTFENVICFS